MRDLVPLGHNGGPPLEPSDFVPATENQRLIARCAEFIALVLNMAEPQRITKTRQLPRQLIARKLLFACLQEARPFGDGGGEVRYGHLSQVELQNALNIYRKTISQDVQEVEDWCRQSPEFAAFVDSIKDGVDAVVCLFDYETRILELASQISGRALDRIRKSVDALNASPVNPVVKSSA